MTPRHNTTIIRKKIIKKSHGGGHGGAWKVAYADFMTAMMAFFLLLWLLSSSDSGKSEAVAAFFQPKVKLVNVGGDGVISGDSSVNAKQIASTEVVPPEPVAKTQAQSEVMGKDGGEAVAGEGGERDGGKDGGDAHNPWMDFTDSAESQANVVDAQVTAARGEITGLAAFLAKHEDRAKMTETAEGNLRIDLLDLEGKPLFASGSFQLDDGVLPVLSAIIATLSELDGQITVTGHTDATPYAGQEYTNWELSADRANAVRRALLANGLAENRILRVIGSADADPADPADRLSPANRRVSIELKPY